MNPPNSHPKPAKKTPKQVRFKLPTDEKEKPEPHETNKTAVIVGAVAVVGLLVLATR